MKSLDEQVRLRVMVGLLRPLRELRPDRDVCFSSANAVVF